MKLNYKRTLLVGFAFFLICAFWQVYDSIIPLTLTNKFGLSQTASGFVMVIDNVLALFMLPLFGAISDKHNGRFGKRTPFIVVGTILAAVLFIGLSFADNAQLRHISEYSKIDDPTTLQLVYDKQAESDLMTPDGEHFTLSEKFSSSDFCAVTSTLEKKDGKLYRPDGSEYALAFSEDEAKATGRVADGKTFTNPHYTNYVAPAQQACCREVTKASPGSLVVFLVILVLVLIAMAIFRSPAVALMPDVTIKPLRSKANAIINLMGSFGGILVLVLGMVLATSGVKNAFMSYTGYFCIVAGIMLVSLFIFVLFVREKKFAAEMLEESKKYGIDETDGDESGDRKLSKGELSSLILLLASVALWYMGYNAVTSKYSVYANKVLNQDYNLTLIIAQAAAIISYLPIGILSSKLGRKKAILGGVVILTAAFGFASLLRANSSIVVMYILFALAGIGWASINVNSFPMVVEMSRGGNIGKYTGFYYTASMAAQAVTPWLSGMLMDKLGMTTLFPYGALFVALAFVTMLLVRHGDSKPEAAKGLEAFDVEE